MDATTERFDALLRSGAKRLTGYQRRLFLAEVATELCDGCPRKAERRFGWGRETVEKGLHESRSACAVWRTSPHAAGPVAKRSTRSWPRTSAPSWNPIRKPIPN